MPNSKKSQANGTDERLRSFFARRAADGQAALNKKLLDAVAEGSLEPRSSYSSGFDTENLEPSSGIIDGASSLVGNSIDSRLEDHNKPLYGSLQERESSTGNEYDFPYHPLWYEQAKNAILGGDTRQLMEILQNWGYDPNYRDKDGKTLLDYAMQQDNEAIIGLLSNGVDIGRSNEAQNERLSEERVSVWRNNDDPSRKFRLESGMPEWTYDAIPDENWYKPLDESLQERRDVLRECIGKHEVEESYSTEAALESFQANYSSHEDMMGSLAILSVKAVKFHEERQGKRVYIYDEKGKKVQLDKLDPSKTYNMVEDARGADLNTPPHGREPYIAQAAEHAMKMMLYINNSIKDEVRANEIRQDIAKKLDGFIKNINDLADKTPELIPGEPGKPNKKFNKAASSMVRNLEASFYASFSKEERAAAVTGANRWYDYVPFHRPHFNRAVIQKFQDKDGHTRTVSFAEHIMGELTPKQKDEFVNIQGYEEGGRLENYPVWFKNLSHEERMVLKAHVPAILAGNKCFPTQLSKIPVLRMGYDTQVYEFSGSKWEGRGGFAHQGAPTSMDGKLDETQRKELSEQIIKQLQEHYPNTLIHIQSTNRAGWFLGRATGEKKKIVDPLLSTAVDEVYTSAAGIQKGDAAAYFDGLLKFTKEMKGLLPESGDNESEALQYIREELDYIEKMANRGVTKGFTPGNVHKDITARTAAVTAAFNRMNENEQQRVLAVIHCKSGKDRTGMASIEAGLAILNSMDISCNTSTEQGKENKKGFAVTNTLILNGINGGTGGCDGAKRDKVNLVNLDPFKYYWEQEYANNNRPLDASKVKKRLEELEKQNPKGKVSQVANSSKESGEGKQSSVAQDKSSGISDKVKGSLGGRYHKDEIKQVSDMSQINWDEIQNISAAAKECMKAVFSNDSLDRRVVEEFKVKHPEESNRNKVYMEVLDNIPENMIKTEVKKGDNNSAIQLKNNQEIIIKRENGKLNITIPEQYTGIITDYYTNSHLLVRDGEIVDLTTGSLPHRFGEIAVKEKDGERKLNIPPSSLDIVSATRGAGRGIGG